MTTAIMNVIALGPTYGPLSRTLLPMSERVQLRRARGWRKPEHTIIVSRPSRWGNPYPVRVYGRNQALRLYAEHLRQHPRVCSAIARSWLAVTSPAGVGSTSSATRTYCRAWHGVSPSTRYWTNPVRTRREWLGSFCRRNA